MLCWVEKCKLWCMLMVDGNLVDLVDVNKLFDYDYEE